MATKTRVTADQLARDLARRLDVDEQKAHEILKGFCGALRDHLQAGQVVEVADLFRLAVTGQAELREDESGGFSAYAPTERGLEVEPLGELRTDLEKACNQSVYYVSRGGGDFIGLLQDYFGRRGWQLVHKQNAMEVQTLIARQPPVAVIFEQHVEGWKDLIRELKCDPRTNWVPVVGIFPEMTDPDPVNEIEIRPDEVIREPFDFAEFVHTAGSELAARVMQPDHDVTEIEVHLPGTERCRGDARRLVEEILFRSALPEEWNADAGGALTEALDNAWRHGHQLIDCCTISVHVLLDPRRLVLAVRDSGTGFDHHGTLLSARSRRHQKRDPLAKAQEALASGTRRGNEREGGITRMLKLVDRVEFNRSGNQVVLTKRRPRPE
ncbi:MAG: ATP-binding protein [Planctomycetota bacterium]|jgi:anti-sigma regulatory factor (Ser/Thr protein kinase)